MLMVTLVSRDKKGRITHVLEDVKVHPLELGDLIGCQQNNSATTDVVVTVKLPKAKGRRYVPAAPLDEIW